MVKKAAIFILLLIPNLYNAQIITPEQKEPEKKKKEQKTKEVKPIQKSGTELYFGVNPAFTYRTLEQNEGIFGKPLGYRESEIGKWTTGFNAGVRTKLSKHIKLAIGIGYSSNRVHYDYTQKDSIFRYTNTYRHISFPINVAYSYGEDISFYGGIGIIPKAFLSMKNETTTLDDFDNEETQENIIRDPYQFFLIDVAAQIGTQIKFSPHYGVFFMVEGRRQLNNNFSKQGDFIRKPFAIGFNVGIEVYL
ncbi:hypothetical protein CW751_10135 [Brumimicrobium salinarum]|uniref:Outer membrane protein beta-barrel domain-containing protein n=1 Tax=Brumimicrobium salinarum TaxID=2058658 RepID=A0A2I0R1H4_9FLAO|nr:outer membrane beta-barrel protein [Brumimicrobium salinarum]PKR80419.1 hypothetical protein CW751_10135 [Brumimicrobium salinarum]